MSGKLPNPYGHDNHPITDLEVCGFKSIRTPQRIRMHPLTVLAGANNAGKSSLIQPFLLLKQTLDATHDPGPLQMHGPNVKFTRAEQLLSHAGPGEPAGGMTLRFCAGDSQQLSIRFEKDANGTLALAENTWVLPKCTLRLSPSTSQAEFQELLSHYPPFLLREVPQAEPYLAVQDRCFYVMARGDGTGGMLGRMPYETLRCPWRTPEAFLRQLVHLPGLRGNPERTYPLTGTGDSFPGLFPDYTASLIFSWQKQDSEDGPEKLRRLEEDLARLGLAWAVKARHIDDVSVEVLVDGSPDSGCGTCREMFSVADMGIGVSQTLPVLVALHAAAVGQTVYIEQPELHLHPRAQVQMAEVLANAALRGVKVIVETHSPLLLLGIMALVAEARLAACQVGLHWVSRNLSDGSTTVDFAQMDESGAYGDWPEDFGDVSLGAQDRYLNAASQILRQSP